MSSKNSGKLIVIDGTDGSGKGTQVELLANYLRQQGQSVKIMDFPRYDQPSAAPVSMYLNGYLGTKEEVSPKQASILYAVDRFAAKKEMESLLAGGTIIIANRYVSASQIHQGSAIADPVERQNFLQWLDNLEYEIFGIPRPDAIIFLAMDPKISFQLIENKQQREYLAGKKRDILEADSAYQKQCYETAKDLAETLGWQVIQCFNNDQPLKREEISQEIIKVVEKIIKRKE